ncbi:MAG TPA: response regulator [Byssovorax sp.]
MRSKDARAGSVLVVDDDPHALAGLRLLLMDEFDVVVADGPRRALELIEERPVDVVMSDYEMPGGSGISLLAKIRMRQPRAVCILMTAHATYPDVTALQLEDRGVRVLLKPLDPESTLATVRASSHVSRIRRSVSRLPRR